MFEVNKTYNNTNNNPFEKPIPIKIVDIKNNYAQYVIWVKKLNRWSSEKLSNSLDSLTLLNYTECPNPENTPEGSFPIGNQRFPLENTTSV